ncbi:hypothetical protein EIN_457820 [Entamoeba invadens IP1]|uniref:Leucine rich repeat containing protein BspA family protein n=1 Tax=Entamoeba invadens IP1 TaxID=370355 RepID=A0A0A1U5E6_ENTIV|nr:hypothetical protein EIN_457820 [Entamoeba invadens IP1]ELP89523.1 hypothetical protein EIN_457820 [Entamoeba invadens IP1]|eukprot:XP_004256294.1 hypothetical protein EIN_457820 [Entamoeba invadens IP1]
MSQLSGYHIMIVSEYFKTIRDFINLELVCKKFGGNMGKYHFNPIQLNSKTIGYFTNIETLHLWNREDKNFGNGILVNTEENQDCENKSVLKKTFFQIIVWFDVDFETVDKNKSRNIEFKNVTYTQNNREKYGNNIPSSVISIGEECFYGCSSLTSVTIPLGVIYMNEFSFGNCINLSSITIPMSVKPLGDECFRQCSSLSSMIIPSSVTYIGDGCFSGCINLSSVTIPSSVISINYNCFSECSSLNSVTIPSGVSSIEEYCFSWCDNLSSVIIPSSVTSIGNYCFIGCGNLSSVTIPLSVISLGDRCFPSNTVVYRN